MRVLGFGFAVLGMVLALPIAVQAQYTYITNNGTITITGYTGPGGAVTIPSEIGDLPVTSIGQEAFVYCSTVTSVTIPNSVTTIAVAAFLGCTGLTDITIPNSITLIGDYTFSSCVRLTNATIPSSVTSIGAYAFSSCGSLTNVTIPASVTSIGSYAFSECNNLKAVYLQGNAPRGDETVFYDNNEVTLLTLYYLPGTTGWGSTFGFDSAPTVLWNPQVQPGSFGIRSNQFGFNITGSSDLVIVIEATTNLANPIWYPLQTNTLNGSTLTFTDPQWTSYPSRFYRVTWP
jgi:hypothetical protein